jgi:DNA (cytosine-5)-methyltransferase 1
MRHGSLFSGIGGFDLAAEWMGWENVFHCEWMEFPRKVLEYHFPNADSLIDICKTDFKKYANKIDILTGGFPCQPFSMAGKRKGTDDERYLWGEMLRAVQEIKPQFVIAENVFGITNIDGGMVFEQVCLDLEAEGYEVQPFIIPAAAKNAPHRRDRCWFIAQNTMFSRCVHGESEQERAEVWKQWNTCTRSSKRIYLSEGNATDTYCFRYRGGNIESRTNKFKEWKMDKNQQQHRNRVWSKVERCSWDATNTNSQRCKRQWKQGIIREEGQRRAKRLGQLGNIEHQWEKFPTQSPICSGDDGLPTKLDGITFSKWRAESIKGYGNAIVPQVAYEIFKQLQPTANCD